MDQRISAHSRSSAGSDLLLVNIPTGLTQNIRALTSVGVSPTVSSTDTEISSYRTVNSYHFSKALIPCDNPSEGRPYYGTLTGDRVGEHIVCAVQVGAAHAKIPPSQAVSRKHGLSIMMATGEGTPKIVSQRLFSGYIRWMRGSMAWGHGITTTSDRLEGPNNQGGKVLLFDLGGRGSIESVASGSISDGNVTGFLDGVLLSSQTALFSMTDGLYSFDTRSMKNAKVTPRTDNSGRWFSNGVLAGCRCFFRDGSFNYRFDDLRDEGIISVQPIDCGGPSGGVWNIIGGSDRERPYNMLSNVEDQFSWSPVQGPLGVVVANHKWGLHSQRVVLVDPRRHHCVEFDRSTISSESWSATDAAIINTPSTIAGMPVLLQVDPKTSRVKVVV